MKDYDFSDIDVTDGVVEVNESGSFSTHELVDNSLKDLTIEDVEIIENLVRAER